MRLSAILLVVLVVVSVGLAQNQAQPPAQTPQQNGFAVHWFPQAIESLGANASSRTEFSLDHNMVVLASKLDQTDDSLRRVIAGVDGISVHRFKFPGPGMYDPQLLNAIRADYNQAGWQHMADVHQKYGYPQGTDLWLHLEHNTIRNIAFLIIRPDQVAFVSVSGSISPIDLLRLAGHFGIPRIQGGVLVPDPGAAPYPPNESAPPPPDKRPAPRDDDYRH
ncbi:MAG TPA: DUF4252 domain-containing protein [Verrucomicrobiae bacterium]|nr:DUF4252 domain-containing protein [Verrucomicrobiae bacterium]